MYIVSSPAPKVLVTSEENGTSMHVYEYRGMLSKCYFMSLSQTLTIPLQIPVLPLTLSLSIDNLPYYLSEKVEAVLFEMLPLQATHILRSSSNIPSPEKQPCPFSLSFHCVLYFVRPHVIFACGIFILSTVFLSSAYSSIPASFNLLKCLIPYFSFELLSYPSLPLICKLLRRADPPQFLPFISATAPQPPSA